MKRLPSPAEIALTATAVLITGGTAYFLTTRKGGVLTGTYSNPLPVPSSDAAAKRVPAVAERLMRLWPEVTGEKGEMPPQALEIALAQAWLESGVAEAGGGGWWTDKTDKGQGNMVGSGNLGARQCGGNDHGGAYYECVAYGDTVPQPDGSSKAIDANFMYFKAGKTPDGKDRDAGDAAAWRFLTDITKTWPALAELKNGDVMAYAKRQGPKAQGGNGYYQGFGATMDERVAGYARAIASHIPAIAAALGHKKVYAKIDPELLAAGPTHAPVTAGVQLAGADLAQALHAAGALPRARAIPGSHGHVVWYIERAELGAAPPRDVVITEQEAAAQDAAMRDALQKDQPDLEGAGTVALAIIAGILVASGIAAAHALGKARDLLGKIRSAGYDLAARKFDPAKGTWTYEPKPGWVLIEPTDPAFAKLRQSLGEDIFERILGSGAKFQRAVSVSGYTSSRWKRSIRVGDTADDITSIVNTGLQTIDKLAPAPKPAPAPAAASAPAPASPIAPGSAPSSATTIAVSAGAAVVVLLAVAAAWRIARPRLGEARSYPAFAWMADLPADAVTTLRTGVPLADEQVRRLTIGQCQTIVDHALLVSKNNVLDPATWVLTGDDRAPLAGTAEAIQASATAVVGVVILVGAILLYREIASNLPSADAIKKSIEEKIPTATIDDQGHIIEKRGDKTIVYDAYGFPISKNSRGDWERTGEPQAVPPQLARTPAEWLSEVIEFLNPPNPEGQPLATRSGTAIQGAKPRWVRWIKPEIGDGAVQADASSAKKIVDGIADKYASKQAAKVVGSTTGALLTGLSIGAALGTAFPGLGNVVGAAVGAIIGALAGLISGLLGLGPSPEAVALAAEIDKFNQRVHTALKALPAEARGKIGAILVDAMRKTVGPYPICVGPGAQDDQDVACVMTSIDGIRDAATHLDENVQKWILQYQAENQAAKTKAYKRVAAVTGGITLAALAALGVAVKTGVVALGDAEPKYPEFAWMADFPPDAISTLRAGAPLDAPALRRLTKEQRRSLAAHASIDTKDGAIDPSTWRIRE